MNRAEQSTAGTVAALLAVVSWGAGPVIVKGVPLPGLTLGFWRMWLGGLLAVAVLYVMGGRLTLRTFRLAAWGGVTFGVNIALFFTAIHHTTVTDAMIISALQPALVFVVVGRMFGERLVPRDLVWTAVAIAGVAAVVLGAAAGSGRTLVGDLYAVGALVTWAWYFVASKAARRELGAVEYQAALMLIGAAVVTPLALLTRTPLGIHGSGQWTGLAAVVIVPGGGHFLMNWAHAHTKLTVTSLLTLASPVFSAVGAWMFLHEQLTLVQLVAMAVVIGALASVVRRMTVSARPSPEPVGT